MKVITIKQPFATLIAEGYKKYEFRTWKTKYRGEILIHAGKGVDKSVMKRFEYLNLNYPTGCIIARTTIEDCILIDDNMKKELKKADEKVYWGAINNKERQEYGFKLGKVEKIEPIYINGKLSLWDYDFDKFGVEKCAEKIKQFIEN